MRKWFVAFALGVLALLISITWAFGQKSGGPNTGDSSPVSVAGSVQADAAQRAPEMLPTFISSTYSDPQLGFSLTLPKGMVPAKGIYDLFRTTNEAGQIGYADRSGVAILIRMVQKDPSLLINEWVTAQNFAPYMVVERRGHTSAGLPIVGYRANWESLGTSVGALVVMDDRVYMIDSFYPANSAVGQKQARAALSSVLNTFKPDAR